MLISHTLQGACDHALAVPRVMNKNHAQLWPFVCNVGGVQNPIQVCYHLPYCAPLSYHATMKSHGIVSTINYINIAGVDIVRMLYSWSRLQNNSIEVICM